MIDIRKHKKDIEKTVKELEDKKTRIDEQIFDGMIESIKTRGWIEALKWILDED